MSFEKPSTTFGASSLADTLMTKDDLFPKDQHLGIRVLHTPTHAEVDIIFIHGLTGHPYRTFVAHDKTYWPTELLSRDIPTARILSFGYDADVVKFLGPVGQNNIREHAATLISDIAAVREDDGSANRPIILIVHSLGGLLVKKALCLSELAAEAHERQLHQTVIGVAFLGTPHRGSDLAPFATGVVRILKACGPRANVDIIRLLKRDSEALADIEAGFGTWLRKNSAFKLTCFFEEREVAGVGMVVSKDSARISGYPQLPIPANHMDIARFESELETGYRRILGELRRWLRKGDGEKKGSRVSAGDTLDFQGCMETLAFPEMNHRGADIESAAEGTCEWITEHPVYRQWCANGQGLLWVKGKPGSGKSTLMKHLFREVEGAPSESTLNIWFFFHGRGTELQRTPLGLFRTILHQIGEAHPQAIRPLIKRYIAFREARSVWSWRHQDLEDFFISDVIPFLLRRIGISLYIDALDECGEVEARRLVAFFTRAYDRASSNSHRLSICFSCRHYPIIAPDICEQIVVESANDGDISTYINQKLSQFVGNEDELAILRREIEQRARQVFLWAVVVLPHVTWMYSEGQTLEQILEYVQETPPELHALYTGLFSKLSGKSARESGRLFQIICYSRENLSISELREAYNYHGDASAASRTLQEWNSLDTSVKTVDQMHKKLRALSAGLAEVTSSGVQLTHQTVQDFLVAQGFGMLDGTEGKSPIQLAGESHRMLSRTCLLYFLALEQELRTERESFGRRTATASALGALLRYTKESFLGYSTRNWLPHASASEDSGIDQVEILDYFRKSGKHRQTIMDTWSAEAVADHTDREETGQPTESELKAPQIGTTLLHEAVKYNIESLVKEMLRFSTDASVADHNSRVALTYAVWGASESIASLMLKQLRDTEINKELRSGDVSFTVFQLALGNNREQIAKEILQTPGFVLEENWAFSGRLFHPDSSIFLLNSDYVVENPTAIDLAVELGLGGILDLLVGMLPEGYAMDTPRLCMRAVSRKQVTILSKLLDLISPDQKEAFQAGGACSLILHEAVRCSFSAGVTCLLSTDCVQLNLTDSTNHNWTALHLAVSQRSTDLVDQLLSSNMDVNAQDDFGNTALHVAVYLGLEHSSLMIKLCVCRKVDPNIQNLEKERAMDLIIQLGSAAVLGRLLERPETQIDYSDDHGQTPLWHAINRGENGIARMLLARESSTLPGLRNKLGTLPFLARAEQDVLDAIEKLDSGNRWTVCDAVFGLCWPEHESDLPKDALARAESCDADGNTLLMWATMQGWVELALTLIHVYGAYVRTRNYAGMTLLMACFKHGTYALVSRILELRVSLHQYRDELAQEELDNAGNDAMWYAKTYGGGETAEGRAAMGALASKLYLPGTQAVEEVQERVVLDRQVGQYRILMTKSPRGPVTSSNPPRPSHGSRGLLSRAKNRLQSKESLPLSRRSGQLTEPSAAQRSSSHVSIPTGDDTSDYNTETSR